MIPNLASGLRDNVTATLQMGAVRSGVFPTKAHDVAPPTEVPWTSSCASITGESLLQSSNGHDKEDVLAGSRLMVHVPELNKKGCLQCVDMFLRNYNADVPGRRETGKQESRNCERLAAAAAA